MWPKIEMEEKKQKINGETLRLGMMMPAMGQWEAKDLLPGAEGCPEQWAHGAKSRSRSPQAPDTLGFRYRLHLGLVRGLWHTSSSEPQLYHR